MIKYSMCMNSNNFRVFMSYWSDLFRMCLCVHETENNQNFSMYLTHFEILDD